MSNFKPKSRKVSKEIRKNNKKEIPILMPNNLWFTRNLLYFWLGPSSANCDAFMTMFQKGDVEHVFICNCIGTLKL